MKTRIESNPGNLNLPAPNLERRRQREDTQHRKYTARKRRKFHSTSVYLNKVNDFIFKLGTLNLLFQLLRFSFHFKRYSINRHIWTVW